MTANWNPWHGCRKFSAGCVNCYVYRSDARYGSDASQVRKNASFYLPIRIKRGGGYYYAPGTFFWTCFTSDFLLEDADPWREEAWRMMRARSDCTFLFITKRIHRLAGCLPSDWEKGYPNVHSCCTMENQEAADRRLPLLMDLPICRKSIACEPLLSPIDFHGRLGSWCGNLVVGGESGESARLCRYDWVLGIRRQCVDAGVCFHFKQTGANFEKDGKVYHIRRSLQCSQAKKAAIQWP